MKPVLIYNGLRLLLWIATFAVVAGVWAAVNHGEVHWMPAFFISAVLSFLLAYPVLMGPRNEMALRIQERADRMLEKARAREDQD